MIPHRLVSVPLDLFSDCHAPLHSVQRRRFFFFTIIVMSFGLVLRKGRRLTCPSGLGALQPCSGAATQPTTHAASSRSRHAQHIHSSLQALPPPGPPCWYLVFPYHFGHHPSRLPSFDLPPVRFLHLPLLICPLLLLPLLAHCAILALAFLWSGPTPFLPSSPASSALGVQIAVPISLALRPPIRTAVRLA